MENVGAINDPRPTMSPVDTTGGGFGEMAPPDMGMSLSSNFSGRPNFNPNRFRNHNMDNSTQGPILLGLGGALVLISTLLLIARIWSRSRPRYRLKLDDWTIIFATVLAIVQYFLLAVSVMYGLGRRSRFVAFARRRVSLRLTFISQLFWYWSITFVKLSVALLLFRLKHTKRWRIFLGSVMGLSIAAVIVQTCFQFLQCRPFSVYWDPRLFRTVEVKCFRRSIINGNIVSFSAIQVGLDLVFSFIPITFIRKLNRPRREKIFMCVLMGLGLFASCAAIIRTMTLQGFYSSADIFRTNVTIALWAIIEQQFALIAANIPTLKAFMERSLVRIGLFFYDKRTEAQMRNRLVDFGLLSYGEELEEEHYEGKRPSKSSAKVETLGEKSSSPKKVRDEFGDTILGKEEADFEKEISFEEMLQKSVKAKEFV